MADLVEIARMPKSKAVSIIFSITEYEGEYYLDIREHVTSKRYTGFTPKGYRFNLRHLPEFLNKLSAIANLVGKDNWQERLEKLRQSQLGQDNKEQLRLDDIYKYIDGVLERQVTSEELYKWLEFCYQNSRYSEATRLFNLISEDTVPKELYSKMKKIADICRIRRK